MHNNTVLRVAVGVLKNKKRKMKCDYTEQWRANISLEWN